MIKSKTRKRVYELANDIQRTERASLRWLDRWQTVEATFGFLGRRQRFIFTFFFPFFLLVCLFNFVDITSSQRTEKHLRCSSFLEKKIFLLSLCCISFSFQVRREANFLWKSVILFLAISKTVVSPTGHTPSLLTPGTKQRNGGNLLRTHTEPWKGSSHKKYYSNKQVLYFLQSRRMALLDPFHSKNFCLHSCCSQRSKVAY